MTLDPLVGFLHSHCTLLGTFSLAANTLMALTMHIDHESPEYLSREAITVLTLPLENGTSFPINQYNGLAVHILA